MSYLVERLRQYAENDMRVEGVCLAAADEIERLREEIELLRKALGRIALVDSQGIALAALGQMRENK